MGLPRLIAALSLLLQAAAGEDYSGWAHSQRLNFNTTSSGAGTANPVKDFPVLVRLGSGFGSGFEFDFTQAQAGGADLRFSDPDGTGLAYQIERWDKTARVAEIWVNVPQVDANSTQDYIVMRWGNSAATSASDGAKVFPPQGGWVGAWHLGEGSKIQRANACDPASPALPVNYDGDESRTGVIGLADSLGGGSTGGDYLDLGTHTWDFRGGFTFSIWAKPGGARSYERFLELGNGVQSDNVIFSREHTTSDLYYRNYSGSNTGNKVLAAGALESGKWQHLAATVLGKELRIYKNGIQIQRNTMTYAISNVRRTANFIGKSAWLEDDFYYGMLDQPELSSVVRSDDWIKLAYQNQKPGSTFLTASAQVDVRLAVVRQPVSRTEVEGTPVSFSVKAVSSRPIAYAWTKDGELLDGETGDSLVLVSIHPSDAGRYACRLSDGVDTMTSAAVTLSVTESYALWSHSMRVSFNTTATGAGVAANIADFPLPIRLDASLFDFAGARPGGADIRFADPDGAPLSFYVARWDAAKSEADIWVRVPEVKGNSDQDYVMMYWGKPDAEAASASTQVFRVSDGFQAVWNLDEAAGAASASDATVNGLLGKMVTAELGKSGVVGTGADFGGGDERIEVPAATTSNLGALTFSLWAKETKSVDCPSDIWSCPGLLGAETNGAGGVDLFVYSQGGKVGVDFSQGAGTERGGNSQVFINDGKWHQVAVTYDGTRMELYEAGKLRYQAPATGALNPESFDIGNARFTGGEHSSGFEGGIDAVQVSRVARDAEWVKLAYETQRTDTKAVVYGAATLAPIPAPTAYPDPASGVHQAPLPITLSCALPDARIYYALDSALPFDTLAPGAVRFRKTFSLDRSGPLTAVAYLDGRASAPLRIAYKLTRSLVSSAVDTLHSGEEVGVGPGTVISYPSGNGNPAVISAVEGEVPAGFEAAVPPFSVAAAIPGAGLPALVLMISPDSLPGASLYRLAPGGRAIWLGGVVRLMAVDAAGVYFIGRDVMPPAIRLLACQRASKDSLRVSFIVDDNVANPLWRLKRWAEKTDSTTWRDCVAGDTVAALIGDPGAASPLEFRLSASDNSFTGHFPPQTEFGFSPRRGLPAQASPLAVPEKLKWTLAGVPMRLPRTFDMGAFAYANGGGGLHAARWLPLPEPGRPDSGRYERFKATDSLPAGAGFWLASDLARAALTLPASETLPSDSDGSFAIRLQTGWNIVTSPSLRPLPWPITYDDVETYVTSPFKPLHGREGDGWVDSDTLRPWHGYFVLNNGPDTVVRVGAALAAGPALAKSAARGPLALRTAAASEGLTLRLQAGGASVNLGARAWASAGYALEDEPLPPPPAGGDALWLRREGRRLASDFIPWVPGAVHRWSLAGDYPRGATARLVTGELPEGWQAWAVSPARGAKYRLDGDGGVPFLGADTLAIFAGTPQALAAVPELGSARETPVDAAFAVRPVPGGLRVSLALPFPARVSVRIWSLAGGRVGGFAPRPVGAGWFDWNSSGSGRLAPALYVVEAEAFGASAGGAGGRAGHYRWVCKVRAFP